MKPIQFNILTAAGVFALGACAGGRSSVKSEFDFSKVRQISVRSFEGAGGQEVSDEFVRELVGAGLEVTDGQHAGDLLLKGWVTEYNANSAAMVFLGDTTLMTPGGQTTVMRNPVISLNTSQTVPEKMVVGTPTSQVALITASVGVRVQLVDPATRRAVWSEEYSYEAIDLPGAREAVVRSFCGAIRQLMARPTRQLS